MRTTSETLPVLRRPGLLGVGLLAVLVSAGACTLEEPDPDDPAGWLGDEPWHDEGPLPADEHSDAEEAVDVDAIYAVAPRFQVPFPCGQTWAGQTRYNHSPRPSIDFNRAYDYGDPVVASAAGRVTRVGNTGNTSYGRWIEISHGNGYTTRYAHLATQTVSVGQNVRQGQKIGTVGSTGGSTGPHLHYEQRHNGYAINVRFNGVGVHYYGTRNYKSKNACGGGGGGHPGQVSTSGARLTVRKRATTNSPAIGYLYNGAHVTIKCQKIGQRITGTYGTTRLWDNVGAGFVSDAYVYTGSDGRVAPDCP